MSVKTISVDNVDIHLLSGKIMGGLETTEIHNAIKSSLDKKTNQIVIDLGEVTWMGSVGIGILICCLTTVRNAGGELKLSGMSGKIKKLLLMTKLDQVFEIFPESEQAANSFSFQ